MRLNSAFHAIARKGENAALTALYRDGHGDLDAVITHTMTASETFILEWISHPTQTNEVGRAASFMAALMHLDDGSGMPNELLELGASAGLNLNLARYGYVLGEQACGCADARIAIQPRWSGAAPRICTVDIAAARGVDLNPIDLTCPDAGERLMAYVWPGQPFRSQQLARAIALARRHPPQVEQGRAGDWLDTQLRIPQRPGVRRVVMHSMVMQYLGTSERRAVMTQLAWAGARATPTCPLAWIALEWNADRSAVLLQMTEWSGAAEAKNGRGNGTTRNIAACHPYGEWIEWRG